MLGSTGPGAVRVLDHRIKIPGGTDEPLVHRIPYIRVAGTAGLVVLEISVALWNHVDVPREPPVPCHAIERHLRVIPDHRSLRTRELRFLVGKQATSFRRQRHGTVTVVPREWQAIPEPARVWPDGPSGAGTNRIAAVVIHRTFGSGSPPSSL